MPQIFHPSFNVISKVTIFGAVALPLLTLVAIDQLNRSQVSTGVGMAVDQPVPFSHQHHVGGLGIDCRFCHQSVEESPFAGLPPAKLCAGCHTQIWSEAPMLQPVLAAAKTGEPIRWRRVHDLPDFVYFDHAAHLAKGVGCASCHGRVDKMPLPWRVGSLSMAWCLDCHRDPGPNLRPKDKLFDLTWAPPAGEEQATAERLMKEYRVRSTRELTTCTACHR